MKAYINNWYYVGGIIFAILAFVLGLFGDMFDPMRRIMIVMYMTLLIHQFEEYAVPGGFPSTWNIGVSGETEAGDRYPLNTKSAFIVNICCAYPIYIAAIIFSDILAINIFMAYFGMAQLLMHGIIMNRKMKTLYNPGVATALLVMFPIGIYTLWYIATHYDVPTWNWWVPLLALPVVGFTTILLPILLNKDKNSPYVFPERDTKGFAIQGKVARLRRL